MENIGDPRRTVAGRDFLRASLGKLRMIDQSAVGDGDGNGWGYNSGLL